MVASNGEGKGSAAPSSPPSRIRNKSGSGSGGVGSRFFVVGVVMIFVGIYTWIDNRSLLLTYRMNLPTKDDNYYSPRTAINRTINASASSLSTSVTQGFIAPGSSDLELDLLVEEEEALLEEEEEEEQGYSYDDEDKLLQQVNVAPLLQTDTAAAAAGETTTTSSRFKFYILRVPALTSQLMANNTKKFKNIYRKELNEASAEVWLHRGMSSLTYEQGQTMDPKEADVFLIPAYLWANFGMQKEIDKDKDIDRGSMYNQIMKEIVDKTKPHIWLSPSPNPNLSGSLGLRGIVKRLMSADVNLYSIGFERNSYWQAVSTDRIIPVPYVLHPPPPETLVAAFDHERVENFVFFRADRRRMARSWAGCDRAIVAPLFGQAGMDIGLTGPLARNDTVLNDLAPKGGGERMSQNQYNHRMSTSDYCLIMCGDTPTTRSFISAVTAGCIPVLVGRWWHGFCDPPCQRVWGWNIAEKPHFPFADQIKWDLVPVVNHTQFQLDPNATLQALFQHYPKERKDEIRAEMKRVQKWLIYGWGDPTDSTAFGEAYTHIWQSIVHFTGPENVTKPT